MRKVLNKTLLLCLLFTFFLNTLCLPQAYASRKKFIPPLILADYNECTLITNLGGLSGGDEESPGVTFADLIPDDGFARGNWGYSLKLDYDVSKLGEFSFYWIKLGREVSDKPGVTRSLDLRKYNYLSFWVKGFQGGERIKVELHEDRDNDGEFRFDKDITSYVYTNAYLPKGIISKNWQKALIPLSAFTKINDWSKMFELVFVFENRAGNKEGTVYIDDIIFGYRPESALTSDEIKRIKAPIASSFRINRTAPEKHRLFGKINRLEIKAETIAQNPFIESVSFEHSTDKGNTWRTLGTDYDVSKKNYRITWQPRNSISLLNCQLRAVATDISGNQNATDVLIERGIKPLADDEFLNLLEKKAFEFFYDHQNLNSGLFFDATGGGDASIASTGFGLTALCVGAERRWINKKEAEKRAELAIDAFLPRAQDEKPLAEGKFGFFYHFLNINTGKRSKRCEISTVDTAILVCGALTAGEYFGGKVREKAEALYKRVEWDKFLCREKGPYYNTFSMGWSPERGFLESYWDFYTDEAMLICFLAIGSPTHPVDPEVFYTWTRRKKAYGSGKPFIYSWHGALFSHQYAHVWFDFRKIVDREGVNWFENSTNATLANRQFCIDNQEMFKGYGPNSWGITSMARPTAYTMHFGVPPAGSGEPQYDGTISPTGPAGSIIFTPYLSLSALKYMYLTHPKLWGKYGLRDSFDMDSDWYSLTYYGIGVAMVVLPIENFRSDFIWKVFMKNRYVKEALRKAVFIKKK